jgi:molybdopterin converting factor small subunit
VFAQREIDERHLHHEPVTVSALTYRRAPAIRNDSLAIDDPHSVCCPHLMSAIGGLTVVTVRYFAAARAAAGLLSENVEVGHGATVGDALEVIANRHGEALGKVLPACSFLLDSVAVRDRATLLPPAAQLDVLPPFAGG